MTAERVLGIAVVTVLLTGVGRVAAHCDTMDGPVVKTAQAALDKGDVTAVLKWVQPRDEAQIREAFQKTLAVRGLGKDAKDLADQYFFETLVRLHRAGEGAPYTGLKPAGAVEPIVAASDKALEAGAVDTLTREVTQLVVQGIRQRFAETLEKKKHAEASLPAGRDFVHAYVEFTHYVEGLHNAAAGAAGHQTASASQKPGEPGGHAH